MADERVEGGNEAAPRSIAALRDEDGNLEPGYLDDVSAAVASGDRERLQALAGHLHIADAADVLQALDPELQPRFVTLLGEAFDFTALTELDETTRVRILEELPPTAVAEGVAELESDDAVYLLEDLDEAERERILAEIPVVDRAALQRSLDYPEESAGRRMQTDFIAVPPFWTVGQTIDYMREALDLPDEFYEIFVVDPRFRLLGTVSLNRILRSKRPTKISDILSDTVHQVRADQDQEEVARLFERYDLVSAAVVDEAGRLVGVLTIDDMVDVIQEEADEDIRRLAGVGDEEISDSVFYISRSRLPWLVVNVGTAFLAAAVIGLFDATIEQMVALAVLMPIVASMGGNAGTQAMTVTVRSIATRDVRRRSARRVVGRELLVGLLNGLSVALLVGTAAGLWFQSGQLGGVIAAALIVNMLVAGLAGAVIPLLLNRLRLDPAIASGVFVTTVTDVVGFFAFLGLAGWWFGLV